MEQIPVPQQDEGESCGYRMLSNLRKVTKGIYNNLRKVYYYYIIIIIIYTLP